MPTKTKKNKVNRNKSLKNLQNTASNKAWFRIAGTKKEFPGQLIQLYYSNLKNNFPGQILKEFDPKEYLKQKQKLNVTRRLKRNKELGLLPIKGIPKRGPGSRGSKSIETKSNFLAWLERMEKE